MFEFKCLRFEDIPPSPLALILNLLRGTSMSGLVDESQDFCTSKIAFHEGRLA